MSKTDFYFTRDERDGFFEMYDPGHKSSCIVALDPEQIPALIKKLQAALEEHKTAGNRT